MTEISIYALCDPDTMEPRYVGQTNDVKGRLKKHIKERGVSAKCQWVEGLVAFGKTPIIKVLQVVLEDEANESEAH